MRPCRCDRGLHNSDCDRVNDPGGGLLVGGDGAMMVSGCEVPRWRGGFQQNGSKDSAV